MLFSFNALAGEGSVTEVVSKISAHVEENADRTIKSFSTAHECNEVYEMCIGDFRIKTCEDFLLIVFNKYKNDTLESVKYLLDTGKDGSLEALGDIPGSLDSKRGEDSMIELDLNSSVNMLEVQVDLEHIKKRQDSSSADQGFSNRTIYRLDSVSREVSAFDFGNGSHFTMPEDGENDPYDVLQDYYHTALDKLLKEIEK
jgi:hypothetical protein